MSSKSKEKITVWNNNIYQYDELDRLKKLKLKGNFYFGQNNDTVSTVKDYTGEKGINLQSTLKSSYIGEMQLLFSDFVLI